MHNITILLTFLSFFPFQNGALVIFGFSSKELQLSHTDDCQGDKHLRAMHHEPEIQSPQFSSARPNEIRDATMMSSCFIISALLGSGLLLRSSQPLSCTKPLQSLSSSFILSAFHHSHVVSLQSTWLLFFFFFFKTPMPIFSAICARFPFRFLD